MVSFASLHRGITTSYSYCGCRQSGSCSIRQRRRGTNGISHILLVRFGPNTVDQNSFDIVHYGVGCVYSSSASVSSIALFGAGREGCAAV